MTNWKWANSKKRVVFRVNDNGSMESYIVNMPNGEPHPHMEPKIKKWLADGNVPDEPPPEHG